MIVEGYLIASRSPPGWLHPSLVSCSCRACVRAGEAKLRERVRDDTFCIAGGHSGKISSAVSAGGVL